MLLTNWWPFWWPFQFMLVKEILCFWFWSQCPEVMLKMGHQHLKLVVSIKRLQYRCRQQIWPFLFQYQQVVRVSASSFYCSPDDKSKFLAVEFLAVLLLVTDFGEKFKFLSWETYCMLHTAPPTFRKFFVIILLFIKITSAEFFIDCIELIRKNCMVFHSLIYVWF